MTRISLTFGLGLATALAAGWFAFPYALYVRRAEPLDFRHKAHAEKSGVSQCTDCHALRDDGSFAGIPQADVCAPCHNESMGKRNWLVNFRQPANVWFSHAIHMRRAKLDCATCHGPYGESAQPVAYQQDRISGYSRQVMDMNTCEKCHRERKVEVGCLGCHK